MPQKGVATRQGNAMRNAGLDVGTEKGRYWKTGSIAIKAFL